MIKIFVTRAIPDSGLKLLQKRKSLQVEVFEEDRPIKRSELLKRIKGVDVLLSILTDKIDAEVMDAAGGSLKMIANYAVGFDNIDLKAAKEREIIVTNTPGNEISEAVAEHTIAMIFALAHRIIEVDDYTRAGKYHGWGPMLLLGTDVMGKTIGLIGTGRIGSMVAKRLFDGFGVKIVYHDVKRNPDFEKQFNAKFRTKEQLLKEADFISIHVPLLPTTKHMISTKELKTMKKTAFIINTSRGPIIDEPALIKALRTGEIGGAGLDVFECEPFIACNPKDRRELIKMKNVVLTPHTASATWGARQAMSTVAAENILAFASGKVPPNQIKI